jgi:hypothetical protein
VVLLHQRIAIGGFDAPQREQRAALDPEILFDPRKQRFVLPQRFLAGDDAPVRYAAIDVLPDLFAEFGLLPHLPEDTHVRLGVPHRAGPGRLRDAAGERPRAKIVAPLLVTGRRGWRRQRLHQQGTGAETGSQHGAARQSARGIIRSHRGSVAPSLVIAS